LDGKNDYEIFKEIKKTPNGQVINAKESGLATILKQIVGTIGDIFCFLFKQIKSSCEQFLASFILPTLTPGMPYTTPVIVKKIIDIIKGIIAMIKDALTLVTDTLNWILKKVAGKILDINIPIPSFTIPLFGLGIVLPDIDINNKLKTEPFASLPTDKVKNLKSQLNKLEKEISKIPLNEIDDINELKDKVKDINKTIKNVSKNADDDVSKLINDIADKDYQINKIKDSNNQDNKDFLDTSISTMETCLQSLKNMIFMSVYDLAKTVIEAHNDVILEKKKILDDYLIKYVLPKNGIKVNYSKYEDVIKDLKNNNVVVDKLNSGVFTGTTIDVKGDTNYVINVVATTVGLFTNYKVSYITYKFTSKLDEFQKIYDELDKNKVIVNTYKVGSKKGYTYGYKGDLNYLKLLSNKLIDGFDTEELDLEEDINKYKIENNYEILQQINKINDLLDKSHIKNLVKTKETYTSPTYDDNTKKNLKKLGITIPPENVTVTGITIDSYRTRIATHESNIDDLFKQIKEVENQLNDFKKRVNESGVKGNVDTKSDDTKIKTLQSEKDVLVKKLKQVSPESCMKSTIQQLLLKLLSFPIQIIVNLITQLFSGVIEFITSLPLLVFNKITDFFNKLLQLPSKDGMNKTMTSAINSVVNIPGDPSKKVKYVLLPSVTVTENVVSDVNNTVDGTIVTIDQYKSKTSDISKKLDSVISSQTAFYDSIVSKESAVVSGAARGVTEITSTALSTYVYNEIPVAVTIPTYITGETSLFDYKTDAEVQKELEESVTSVSSLGVGGSYEWLNAAGTISGKIILAIINLIEGGYAKKGEASGGSGETMFGIDATHADPKLKKTSVYRYFWGVINEDKEKNPTKWVHYYQGGQLRSELIGLTGSMVMTMYRSYTNRYLSAETAKLVNSDKRLMTHMIYAVWNGEGNFQRWGELLNKQVKNGNTNTNELFDISINARYAKGSYIAKSASKVVQIANMV
jgi:prefoldin subunit 5